MGSSAFTADVVSVIVVHNHTRSLPACLEALAAAANTVDARVVVVDSGSRDGCEALCERLGVTFLPGPNRGMAAAFNRALCLEQVTSARYVLQLNPDVVLPPGGLDLLVACADRHPACGILAPRQIDQHGALVCSIGVEPSAGGYWRSVRELWSDWDWDPGRYEQEGDVDWVMGACMLLRREMLAAVGGFDERFFLYSEEVDLCRRSRAAGWPVRYSPAVTIVHPVADRAIDEHRVRLEEWSRLIYIRKWFGFADRVLMRVALAVRFARLSVRKGFGADRDALLRLGATLHFSRRRYGAAPPGR
jgi:N-acetylglucosaminyl-diphospho-decaprenol L-rhamnosyltransferase